MARYAYAETILTSLSRLEKAPYILRERAGGIAALRRGTAITLVGLLVGLLVAVALQLVLNR